MLALARMVALVAKLIIALIALVVVLRLLDVDAGVLDEAAAWLVGPFKGLVSLDNADLQLIVNWGLAALAYALASALIFRLLAGADGHGRGRPVVGRG